MLHLDLSEFNIDKKRHMTAVRQTVAKTIDPLINQLID